MVKGKVTMITKEEWNRLKEEERYGMIRELFNRTDLNNRLIMDLRKDIEKIGSD